MSAECRNSRRSLTALLSVTTGSAKVSACNPPAGATGSFSMSAHAAAKRKPNALRHRQVTINMTMSIRKPPGSQPAWITAGSSTTAASAGKRLRSSFPCLAATNGVSGSWLWRLQPRKTDTGREHAPAAALPRPRSLLPADPHTTSRDSQN